MIRVDNARVKISGSKILIMTQLEVLLKSIREDGAITDEELEDIVEESKLSSEELDNKLNDKLNELMLDLFFEEGGKK